VSNLFTREFFTLGKRKLRPGGIWTQWAQLYGMASEDIRSLLAAMGSATRGRLADESRQAAVRTY